MPKNNTNRNLLQRSSRFLVATALILSIVAVVPLGNSKVHAATLKMASVRLDSLVASATSVSGRACFISDQTATPIKSFTITFPTTNGSTDYTLSTILTNWTTNTSNLDTAPATQNAVTGLSANATVVSGHSVTFDDSVGFTPANTTNVYCFNWAGSGLTNPAAWTTESVQGTFNTYSAIGGTGLISNSTFSEPKTVTTNGTNVSVSATVPPSFSFSLNGTADAFGTINLSAVNFTPGLQATVVTNAGSGWIIWARSTGNGICTKGCIYSPSKSYGVQSSAAVGSAAANITTGAEHYDFSTTAKALGASGSCTTLTQSSYFDGITTAGWGGPLDKTALWPVASCNGSSTSATVNFREAMVAIASTPAANDYADTIVMTGAGQF